MYDLEVETDFVILVGAAVSARAAKGYWYSIRRHLDISHIVISAGTGLGCYF
jgi:hypothetical protein